jgi:hypothetical protein
MDRTKKILRKFENKFLDGFRGVQRCFEDKPEPQPADLNEPVHFEKLTYMYTHLFKNTIFKNIALQWWSGLTSADRQGQNTVKGGYPPRSSKGEIYLPSPHCMKP